MSILEQIKDCEKQAADIRADAAVKARDLVRAADQAGRQMAEEILETARQDAAAYLETAAQESRRAADAFVQQRAQQETLQLRGLEKNLDAAVGRIVEGVMAL